VGEQRRINVHQIWLGGVLVIGIGLRFFQLTEIPMTHDELSALSRLQFDNFGDLLRQGVAIDGHPAGVQTFLYYWTMLFGSADWVIKLPFLLMGVGSIYLGYFLGKKWFGPTAGLLTATMISLLQFSVMYSQIARPYSSGLFLCLLATIYWSRIIFENGRKKPAILFAVLGSLCCYNHYFSLLFAGLLGFLGLFFLKKDNWKIYIYSLLGVLLLFSPHAWIFLQQLSLKGLAWLAPPRPFFFLEHIGFIFGFNQWLIFAVLLGAGFGIYHYGLKWNAKKTICLFLFLVPMLIAFFYSHWRQPVMQHSIFLFTMPFLLLLIFSMYPDLKGRYLSSVMVVLMGLSLWTLIGERQHYSIFYQQPFNQFANVVQKESIGQDKNDVFVAHGMNPEYIDHYLRPQNEDFSLITTFTDSVSTKSWERWVDQPFEKFIIMNVPNEYLGLMRGKEGYRESQIHGFIHTIHVFEKGIEEGESVFFNQRSFINEKGTLMEDSILTLYEGPLVNVTQNRASELQVGIDFKGYNPVHSEIICEIEKSDGQKMSRNSYLWNFSKYPSDTIWNRGYLNVHLMDVFFWDEKLEGDLKLYIRNSRRDYLLLRDATIQGLTANDIKYGLYEPLR